MNWFRYLEETRLRIHHKAEESETERQVLPNADLVARAVCYD
jgi:hypothetical protein